MKRDKLVKKLLEINDFELNRNKNHNIYKHKNCGQILVTPKTTSDLRSIKNVINQIKKYFEINNLGEPVL